MHCFYSLLRPIYALCLCIFIGTNIGAAQAQNEQAYLLQAAAYDQQVKKLVYSDLEKASLFNDSIARLAVANNNDSLMVTAQLNAAVIARSLSEYSASDSLLQIIFEKLEGLKANDQLLSAYYQAGVLNHFIDNRVESLEYLFKAAELADSMDNRSIYAKTLNVIGLNYRLQGDFASSVEYYRRSLNLSKSVADTTSEMIAYNSIGVVMMRMDSVQRARSNFENALRLALKTGNKITAAGQYRNLGVIDQMLGNYQRAEGNLEKSMQMREELGTPLQMIGSYYDFAENQRQQGKFANAEPLYLKSLKLAEEIKSTSSQSEILAGLSQLYEAHGKYSKALETYKQMTDLQDSIHSADVEKEMLELEAKFETSQKEKQLAENQLIIKSRTSQRNLILALSALAIIGLFHFWNQNRFNKKLLVQEQTINNHRISELKKENQINSMSFMIEGQEAERRRIAKDLHDGLGGVLTSVKTQMAKINQEVSKLENANIYESVNSMINKAHEEVRRISHNMVPGVLLVDGLSGAIENIVDQLEMVHNINVDTSLHFNNTKLSEAQSYMIYRIFQEASNNIIKHSQASEALFQLTEYDDHFNMVIEDNGIGFDQSLAKDGLGLRSIKSRVDFLKGDLDISSSDRGTSININIPGV